MFYPFLLSPQIAALAMSGSSALVVIDALLLERTKLEGIRTATKAVASDASFVATPSRPGELGPAAVGDSSGSDRVLPSSTMTFLVGFHSLHPDVSMNFQMNRWFSWAGEPDVLKDMRALAPHIATYADWKREFVAVAERASQQGHILRAGFYWRSAEFFMRANDPDREGARKNLRGTVRSVDGVELGARHAVPYAAVRLVRISAAEAPAVTLELQNHLGATT